MNSNGELALTPHPEAFGDKLENPLVTTDFSESQLELITPAFSSIEETFQFLNELQDKVIKEIGHEYLWPFSMPPRLPAENEIPPARYNDSEEGKKKMAYREYLSKNYGRRMQMICGIHYNFSFSQDLFDYLHSSYRVEQSKEDFKNDVYFSLGRNFLRYRWLFIYLLGASPIVDKSYEQKFINEMKVFGKLCCCVRGSSYYLPYATSLRVSRLGYSNALRGDFPVSTESLSEYIADIKKAVSEGVLANESEYYTPIRFKQMVRAGETQLDALKRKGINHIEIRTIDLNPFEKVGISLEQLYFTQVFMLFCLLEKSDAISEQERAYINENHALVALSGAKKDLMLHTQDGGTITLEHWGEQLLDKMREVAKLLDQNFPDSRYEKSVQAQLALVKDKERLPSVRVLKAMSATCESFVEFGIERMKELGLSKK